MVSTTPWREFDGTRDERLVSETGYMWVLIFRGKPDGEHYIEVASSLSLCSDGWHRGRNEEFTHWVPVSLPES